MSSGYVPHPPYQASPVIGSSQQRDIPDTAAMTRVKVYIISETRLFREGLNMILVREGRFEVVGLGPSADALESVRMLAPELVLLDMAGPGLAVVRQLHMILPALRIIAVALAEMDGDVIACAEAGVCAYVPRDATVEELAATMMRARGGEVICPPRITAQLFDRLATLSFRLPSPAEGSLTRREREIASLIARGLQNKEIARHLCLATATVKNHVHSILQKLKLQSRNEICERRQT